MTSNSGGAYNFSNEAEFSDRNSQIAVDFQRELNSLLEIKPPISKDKMNHIVKEALKEIRHYKHVVYYVESFIKNCSSEYKIPGLYVIDAIIRNSKTQSNNHKEVYSNRFSKNMCKTFSNLFAKCPESDREKITRVLQLWQKYNILDTELIDKLNRISSMATIDCAINSSNNNVDTSINNDVEKLKRLTYLQQKLAKLQEQQKQSDKIVIDDKLISEIHKLSSQLLKNEKKRSNQPSTPPITTKTEINKILDFENDLDSDSDNNNRSINNHDENYDNESTSTLINNNEHLNMKLKRKSSNVSAPVVFNEDTLNPSERFRKSIDNCAAWLKTTVIPSTEPDKPAFKKINLPDLSQPPPPLLANYKRTETTIQNPPLPSGTPPPMISQFGYNFQSNSSSVDSILYSASKRLKPSTPPLDTNKLQFLNPLINKPIEVSSSTENNFDNLNLAKEKERDRSRRGLPNIREKHICICSKTLWLGHLSKTTSEDYVIDELTELLSPSSSNDLDNKRNRNAFDSNNKSNKNYQNIIVDCQIIPPRGCAYVEFLDRKTASKCLERMKDGYRLDGNSIKVAWATNKGINKDRQIKSYWNVEVGCTYVPWSDLDNMNTIDFIKWAEGGLIDEDSIPEKYLTLFKKQMLQLANADTETKKESSETNKNQVHDMELDTEEDSVTNQNNSSSITSSTLNMGYINGNMTAQQLQLPPPPLPPQPLLTSQLQPPSLQIPPQLLSSELLNHLRNNQPPPSQIDPNLLSHNQNQLQFLSGLSANTQQPQLQDIQSAIAHFQQMNAQNQSQFNNSNSNNGTKNQSSQILSRMNMNQQQNNQNRSNIVFSSNPSTSPSTGTVLSNLISSNQILTGAIPFADLIGNQLNQQRNQQQNPLQNHLAAIQQQQQQAFSASLAGNPHLAQHFQLVQRPLLISSRQPNLIRNLNETNPNGLTSISNLLGNSNQNPIQLLTMQSPNQQQQQNINLQMRNISAVLAAAAQNHRLQGGNLNQPSASTSSNGQPFFLPNQAHNNKIPKMIFLSEAQFQDINQQQHLMNQQAGAAIIKSPTVSSTTTSFAEIPGQTNQNEQFLAASQTHATPPPQLAPINPKPLMDMSFDSKFLNVNEKIENTVQNDTIVNIDPNKIVEPNLENIDEQVNNDLLSSHKNSTGFYNNYNDRSNNWRNSNNNNNSRRFYNGSYKPNENNHSRSFSNHNNSNYHNKSNEIANDFHRKSKNWSQSSWNQSGKRNDEDFKRNSSPFNISKSSGSSDYDSRNEILHHSMAKDYENDTNQE